MVVRITLVAVFIASHDKKRRVRGIVRHDGGHDHLEDQLSARGHHVRSDIWRIPNEIKPHFFMQVVVAYTVCDRHPTWPPPLWVVSIQAVNVVGVVVRTIQREPSHWYPTEAHGVYDTNCKTFRSRCIMFTESSPEVLSRQLVTQKIHLGVAGSLSGIPHPWGPPREKTDGAIQLLPFIRPLHGSRPHVPPDHH